MPLPEISLNVHFYPGDFDIFAKSKYLPGGNKPSAAIITAVSVDTINVVVFPDGRTPVNRQNVKYYTEEGDPRYKFVGDPEMETFWAEETADFSDPVESVSLFFTGDLLTGTIVFTDQALTTPYIAQPYLMNRVTGLIYEVDQTTGELTEVVES